MRRTRITFALASLALTGGLVATSGQASASPAPDGSSGATEQQRNANGSTTAGSCWYNSGWYCNNRAPVTIYKGPVQDRIPAGKVTTSTSWFKCRAEGTPTGGGGPHPNRWIRTQADKPSGAWGWMKDSHIASETNSLPVC